jgi:uncharacterized protein
MAETFRPNPAVDVATAVTQLSVGEALVSVLDATGSPTPVERAWIIPPHGHVGAITPEQRAAVRTSSPVGAKYDLTLDRESAFEKLNAPAAAAAPPAAAAEAPAPNPTPAPSAPAPSGYPAGVPVPGQAAPPTGYPAGVPAPGAAAATQAPPAKGGGMGNAAGAAIAGAAGGLMGAFGKSALRSFGTQFGREVSRGLLGGMTGSTRRR